MLPDFLHSLRRQTYSDWRLWVRDDGSSDDSLRVIREELAGDVRLHVLDLQGAHLGPGQSFGRLLNELPPDATYIMFADQDDVWLPTKIERTLAVVRAEEPGPVLVHTDLTVTDATLNVVHASFWRFAGFDPEPVTLRRIAVRNVTTGAATMFNRALLELARPIPPDAFLHDWWLACVAAAFGRVVAVRESTVLYRQHGTNAVGARASTLVPLHRVPPIAWQAVKNVRVFRRDLARSAAQAAAFVDRYGDQLSADDRAFLERYARIPRRGFVGRKLDALRYRALPEQGLLGALGVLIRA